MCNAVPDGRPASFSFTYVPVLQPAGEQGVDQAGSNTPDPMALQVPTQGSASIAQLVAVSDELKQKKRNETLLYIRAGVSNQGAFGRHAARIWNNLSSGPH